VRRGARRRSARLSSAANLSAPIRLFRQAGTESPQLRLHHLLHILPQRYEAVEEFLLPRDLIGMSPDEGDAEAALQAPDVAGDPRHAGSGQRDGALGCEVAVDLGGQESRGPYSVSHSERCERALPTIAS